MFKFKNKESNLDERQELTLLKIERNGCWFAFWALLIAMIVEMFVFGPDPKTLAGEWVVFMLLALYLSVACLRAGIWDRRLKPDMRTNILVSAIAAVATGLIFGLITYTRYPEATEGSIASGIFIAGFVFISCLIGLSVTAHAYKKRQAKLEAENVEEEEI